MPRSLRNNPQLSSTKGIDATRNTTTFVHLLVSSFRTIVAVLVKLLQVHAVIQRSDLIAIAVKYDRLSAEQFSQPVLRRLAPSRMVYCGIHVGIESVLVGRGVVPSCRRFLFLKFYLSHPLSALFPLFPP